MRNPLVSIIVPVYNVEKYLKECLNSIFYQGYDKYEVIAVNDGSTDNSGKILDEYAKTHNNLRVIHKKNAGAALARKDGLNMSKGEYIMFVDADDILNSSAVEILIMYTLNNADTEVVISDYDRDNIDIDINKDFLPEASSINRYFIFEKINQKNATKYETLWGKLIKKELFTNVEFLPFAYSEDNVIMSQIYDKAKKVIEIDLPLYHWLIQEGQATGNLNMNRIDCVRAAFYNYDYFASKNESVIADKYLLRAYKLLLSLRRDYDSCEDYKKEANRILKNIELKYRKKLKASSLGIIKIAILLMWKCKYIYSFIVKFI